MNLRRYGIEALVVVLAFVGCLVAREGYYAYERANAAFAWAQEANCIVFPARCAPPPRPPQIQPTPGTTDGAAK